MMNKIDADPEHLKIVKKILAALLPASAKVWVFGSRVTGTAKPYSDLDLVVEAEHPLSLGTMAKLADAFDESNLPYKIDVVDWHAMNESFRDSIKKQRVLLNHI